MIPTKFAFADEKNAEEVSAGDYAELLVYEAEADDVLRVPANAVYSPGASPYVYVMENGEKVYTPVTVGIKSASFTEITSGLQEGDVVFVKQ